MLIDFSWLILTWFSINSWTACFLSIRHGDRVGGKAESKRKVKSEMMMMPIKADESINHRYGLLLSTVHQFNLMDI